MLFFRKKNKSRTDEKLRVLFITHGAYFTGAPISLLAIVRYIREHYDWDLRILVRKHGPLMDRHEALAPTEVFLLPGEGDQRPDKATQSAHYKRLKRDYAAWDPHVIYSNTAMNGDCIEVFDLPAPVAVHVRELERTLKQLKGMRLESFLRRTDIFVAVSEAVRSHLKKAYNVPDEKFRLAHAAIEEDAVRSGAAQKTDADLRAELGIAENDFVVGGVGFVGLRKGVDLFVETAIHVLRDWQGDRPVTFLWIGETTEPATETAVLERIREAGVTANVRLLGLKENPYPYMRLFDVLLMTSRDDPFPRVNIECGLLGTPMITFEESGGSREFAEGDCGVIVPGFEPADMAAATIQILHDDARRAQIGENARKKVESRYLIGVVGPKVASIIQELAARRAEATKS